jgi:hypothetical protein
VAMIATIATLRISERIDHHWTSRRGRRQAGIDSDPRSGRPATSCGSYYTQCHVECT